MQISDVIAQSQNGRAIQNFARAANVDEEQMEAAIRSVVGDMTLSIERNTLNRGGLADLVRAAGDGHHEFILDHPQAMADPRVAMDGNEILEHILGSKDKSRGVAMRAAQASGLSDGLIKMLLPYIAQMLMGAITKWLRGSGGLGDIINKLPIPGGGGGGGGLPLPMPGSDGQRSGGAGGGGGFELPRGDIPRTEMPQGGYPMPPIPGGTSGGGTGSYPAPQEQGDGGFQIPWPGGGGGRRGAENQGGSPFPFPFPFPFPQGGGQQDGGQQGDDGGFQIPWPRQQQPRGGGGGMGGGFELPRGEMPMPQGGYPMPPIPGGSSGGGTGSFPVPGQTQEHGNPLPLPLPGPQGGNNPYGDLSDILRRGGSVPGASGPLGGIVRSILGGLLGFGGRGIMGWVIRLLVMRFGWSFLKRVLGRMLTGGR